MWYCKYNTCNYTRWRSCKTKFIVNHQVSPHLARAIWQLSWIFWQLLLSGFEICSFRPGKHPHMYIYGNGKRWAGDECHYFKKIYAKWMGEPLSLCDESHRVWLSDKMVTKLKCFKTSGQISLICVAFPEYFGWNLGICKWRDLVGRYVIMVILVTAKLMVITYL